MHACCSYLSQRRQIAANMCEPSRTTRASLERCVHEGRTGTLVPSAPPLWPHRLALTLLNMSCVSPNTSGQKKVVRDYSVCWQTTHTTRRSPPNAFWKKGCRSSFGARVVTNLYCSIGGQSASRIFDRRILRCVTLRRRSLPNTPNHF